jgi:hypothetical protein
VPDVKDIEAKMHAVYKTNRVEMGKKARQWIKREFDTDVIFRKKWTPFLDMLEKEIYNKT